MLIRPYRLKDELPVLFPNIGLDRSKFRTHGMEDVLISFLFFFLVPRVDFLLMIYLQATGRRRAEDEQCWKTLQKSITLTR